MQLSFQLYRHNNERTFSFVNLVFAFMIRLFIMNHLAPDGSFVEQIVGKWKLCASMNTVPSDWTTKYSRKVVFSCPMCFNTAIMCIRTVPTTPALDTFFALKKMTWFQATWKARCLWCLCILWWSLLMQLQFSA